MRLELEANMLYGLGLERWVCTTTRLGLTAHDNVEHRLFLCETSGSGRGRMANWAEQLQRELAGRGLAVASVPGKGRGLVASRTFFPG